MSTLRTPFAVRSTNRPDAQPRPRRRHKGPNVPLASATNATPLSAEPMMTMAGPTCQAPALNPLARWSHACLQRDSPLTRLETTPFLYGHGTALGPITEQCSLATLRTTPSFSTAASDLSTLLPGGRRRGLPPPRSLTQPALRHRPSFRFDDLDALGQCRRYDAVPGPATMAGTTDEAASSEEEEDATTRPALCSWESPTTPLRCRSMSPGRAGCQKRRGPLPYPRPQYRRHPSQAPRACKVCLQPLGSAERLWAGLRAGRANEVRPRPACSRCVVRSLALRAVCCDVH